MGFDQLRNAADALRNKPMQRQIVLQIWDSRVDAPLRDGSARSEDIPCNVFSCVKVVNGRLEWLQLMRSNDLILGLPYNIFQWTMLQEILAGWLGLELGSYNQVSDSLHIYERDIHTFAMSDVRSSSISSSDLRLPMEHSEQVFAVLAAAIEVIGLSTDPDTVLAQLRLTSLPIDYEDLLRVMVVERLRRLGSGVLASRVTGEIRDAALQYSVMNWNTRFKGESWQ
ncbi:thymidylate synthase [Pseudarthrobacter sulfonivorans]|nr:thymidylate synthase [Pseudarthrobacter sulfonivorans]